MSTAGLPQSWLIIVQVTKDIFFFFQKEFRHSSYNSGALVHI